MNLGAEPPSSVGSLRWPTIRVEKTMSNLGDYQRIVELAKKAGSPKKLGLITLAVGAVAWRGIEAGGRYAIRRMREANTPCPTQGQEFTVTTTGTRDGLTLKSGDRYRVLECDDDAILIELDGNDDNPHVVAKAFLHAVSNYPKKQQRKE